MREETIIGEERRTIEQSVDHSISRARNFVDKKKSIYRPVSMEEQEGANCE